MNLNGLPLSIESVLDSVIGRVSSGKVRAEGPWMGRTDAFHDLIESLSRGSTWHGACAAVSPEPGPAVVPERPAPADPKPANGPFEGGDPLSTRQDVRGGLGTPSADGPLGRTRPGPSTIPEEVASGAGDRGPEDVWVSDPHRSEQNPEWESRDASGSSLDKIVPKTRAEYRDPAWGGVPEQTTRREAMNQRLHQGLRVLSGPEDPGSSGAGKEGLHVAKDATAEVGPRFGSLRIVEPKVVRAEKSIPGNVADEAHGRRPAPGTAAEVPDGDVEGRGFRFHPKVSFDSHGLHLKRGATSGGNLNGRAFVAEGSERPMYGSEADSTPARFDPAPNPGERNALPHLARVPNGDVPDRVGPPSPPHAPAEHAPSRTADTGGSGETDTPPWREAWKAYESGAQESRPDRAATLFEEPEHSAQVLQFRSRRMEAGGVEVSTERSGAGEASLRIAEVLPVQEGGALPRVGAREARGVPPVDAAWNARESLLERLTDETAYLLKVGKQEAEIHLDPPELGRLRLRLTVVDASVHGIVEVENSAVRSAFESDLPRLAAALAERGLNLHQFDVLLANERRSDSGREFARFSEAPGHTREQETPESTASAPARAAGGGHIVDLWF